MMEPCEGWVFGVRPGWEEGAEEMSAMREGCVEQRLPLSASNLYHRCRLTYHIVQQHEVKSKDPNNDLDILHSNILLSPVG